MSFKKKIRNWLYAAVYPGMITGAIRLITATLRIERVGIEPIDEYRRSNRRILFAFWHGRHFLMIPCLYAPNVSILTSTSRDGRLLADVLRNFGYDSIPGSSHKSPVRALLACVNRIREGQDVVFAVDGPTGPIHSVKPGAVFVAAKSGASIIPVVFSCKPCAVFNSWDKFMLPLPFGKAVLLGGTPIPPPEKSDSESIESIRRTLENTLNSLMAEADRRVGMIKDPV
ncbi:MAG: lysophospholipid acyltransferase family protein [bacterium]|nr:lysophospholipid acyltransferase family protein [bacterium]